MLSLLIMYGRKAWARASSSVMAVARARGGRCYMLRGEGKAANDPFGQKSCVSVMLKEPCVTSQARGGYGTLS